MTRKLSNQTAVLRRADQRQATLRLTVPAHIGRRLIDAGLLDRVFVVELTEEGVLFRLMPENSDPSWLGEHTQ